MKKIGLQQFSHCRKNEKTRTARIAPVAWMFLIFAGAAHANSVTFYDGTFINSPVNWSAAVSSTYGSVTGTPAFAFTAPGSGGDLGGFEMETHSFNSSTAAGVYIQNFDAMNYFTGTFQSVTYGYNLESLSALPVGYSLAIKDPNGVLWMYSGIGTFASGADVAGGAGWTTDLHFGVPATGQSGDVFCQVLDQTVCSGLNFSIAGTWAFGYEIEDSDSTGGPRSYSSGLDNFCVTLNGASGTAGPGAYTGTQSCAGLVTTPEPSSLALCCAMALLIGMARLLLGAAVSQRKPDNVTKPTLAVEGDG
jgi:hypothetical protein